MKKSEITFIRLMSLALIMVINAAVLLFFVGEHTFQNILNRMNSNVYDGGTLDTSIYNYYFYAGFGSIYKIYISNNDITACDCGGMCIQKGEYGIKVVNSC